MRHLHLILLMLALGSRTALTAEEQEPRRIHEEVARTTKYADAPHERATQICGCTKAECKCSLEKLRAADIAFVTEAERPATVSAVARPAFERSPLKVRLCIVAFDIAVGAPADVTVDWQRVTLVVGGVARPAVPGFARRSSAGLPQRSTTAPAGTLLREEVFVDAPLDDAVGAECIAADAAVISLHVPFKLGAGANAIDDKVVFTTRTEPVPMSEAEVFRSYPRPWHPRNTSMCAFGGGAADAALDAEIAAWSRKRRALHID